MNKRVKLYISDDITKNNEVSGIIGQLEKSKSEDELINQQLNIIQKIKDALKIQLHHLTMITTNKEQVKKSKEKQKQKEIKSLQLLNDFDVDEYFK